MYQIFDILKAFAPLSVNEGKSHTHATVAKAEEFSTLGIDPATTELEFLMVIVSLILAEKPHKILETGTGCGFSSLLFCAALCVNEDLLPSNRVRMGSSVTTVDTRFLASLEYLAHKFDLRRKLKLRSGKGIDYIAELYEDGGEIIEEKFDLCFFDSVQDQKGKEALAMIRGDLLNDRALLIFHDTSPHRFEAEFNPDAKNEEYLDELEEIYSLCNGEVLSLQLSRGLTIFRYKQPTN